VGDEKWEQVRDQAFERDNYECQYIKYLKSHSGFLWASAVKLVGSGYQETLVPAHIYGKGQVPKLKYEVRNIVITCHIFHHRLDLYKHPITEERLSNKERFQILFDIIGEERAEELFKLRSSQ